MPPPSKTLYIDLRIEKGDLDSHITIDTNTQAIIFAPSEGVDAASE